jgi:hypothetical protein
MGVAVGKELFFREPFLADDKIEVCREYLQKHSMKRNLNHILKQ